MVNGPVQFSACGVYTAAPRKELKRARGANTHPKGELGEGIGGRHCACRVGSEGKSYPCMVHGSGAGALNHGEGRSCIYGDFFDFVMSMQPSSMAEGAMQSSPIHREKLEQRGA